MSLHECAKLFKEEECEKSNIVDSLVAEIYRRYCFSSPMFRLRRPLRNQKLNTPLEKELAISYDHFRSGFRLPLISEWVDILNYYGFVPAQIFPNGVALVTAVIIFLGEKKIPFSTNLFSKLVMPKKYAGGYVMFQSKKGVIRLEGIPSKITDWKNCYCLAFCENWEVPTEPIEHSANYFVTLDLTPEENYRYEQLKGHTLKYQDYITSNRISEVLMRGMPFIGDDIPPVTETSEEIDSTVLRLEGGESSNVEVYAPLQPPEVRNSEEPSGPDPKGKRKMPEGYSEEKKEKKKFKSPQGAKEKPKKAIINIDIDTEFAKGVEARSLEDLSDYVGKWVENVFEGVARIEIGTQSIFGKIIQEKKESKQEMDKLEELHAADIAKISGQEKKIFELEARISELEARISLLDKEQLSLITKNAEDILAIKRDALERITEAEKKAKEEIDLKKKSSDDFIEDYKQKCRNNLAIFKEKADQTINELKKVHKEEMEQAKTAAIKEFTRCEEFGKYFKTMHLNTVDDVLNTIKKFGDIPNNYDHGILFSRLSKPNADV